MLNEALWIGGLIMVVVGFAMIHPGLGIIALGVQFSAYAALDSAKRGT
jgi:hypothetical protein